MTNDRSKLPNQPSPVEQPPFRHLKTVPDSLPHGPGRHYDKAHFELQEHIGAIVMWTLVGVVVFWVGVDLGFLPDVFGWHDMPQ
jgi:hypothetical protein